MENLEVFLEDLTALTIKHQIVIGGCGCCGSPYIYSLGCAPTWKNIDAENLKFDKDQNAYRAVIVSDAEKNERQDE